MYTCVWSLYVNVISMHFSFTFVWQMAYILIIETKKHDFKFYMRRAVAFQILNCITNTWLFKFWIALQTHGFSNFESHYKHMAFQILNGHYKQMRGFSDLEWALQTHADSRMLIFLFSVYLILNISSPQQDEVDHPKQVCM